MALQPGSRGNSWRLAIEEQRYKVADHIEDNPSLNAMRDEALATAYRYARVEAERETGLARDVFPTECPWTYDEIIDETFWPEG